MNMRKLILFMIVVVIALTLMGGLALAGGWTTISYTASGNATDPTYWNPSVDGHPHGNFSSTSNKCRVCHAVHLAAGSTWRLLQGATGPADACDACHGTGGFTNLRPYDNAVSAFTANGEHTLNAATIPDATNSAIAGGLVCNSCHSVHGANTLMDDSPLAYAVSNWDPYILRKDPNRDGTELAQNATGGIGDVVGGLNDNADAVKSGFCADCHTKNPNWNLGGDSDEDGTGRANATSHVQGPDANGYLSVNGVTGTQVAGFGLTTTTSPQGQTATKGCRACHSATDGGNSIAVDQSAFPHRTKGSKLLFDAYNGEQVGAGDPTRALKQMDQVCGGCHDENSILGDNPADAGVGNSF